MHSGLYIYGPGIVGVRVRPHRRQHVSATPKTTCRQQSIKLLIVGNMSPNVARDVYTEFSTCRAQSLSVLPPVWTHPKTPGEGPDENSNL